jgi:hypothetical protein
MNTSNRSSTRAVLCTSALLALGCAFVLAIASTPALRAESASLQPLADMAPKLPLSASFEKAAGAENAPYVLTLTNDSKDTVKASAKVLLAVAFHAESKARNVPEQVIEPGKTWTIADLAKGDRVVVSAEGFAALELTVE